MKPAPPVTRTVLTGLLRESANAITGLAHWPRDRCRTRMRSRRHPMSGAFDLDRFLVDVFDPVPGERAVVMVDLPTPASPDNPAWADRRVMAAEWRDGL